jgi:hypothetical protein
MEISPEQSHTAEKNMDWRLGWAFQKRKALLKCLFFS